jgi:hypothetical protein
VKSGVVNSGSAVCNRWKEGQKAIKNRLPPDGWWQKINFHVLKNLKIKYDI